MSISLADMVAYRAGLRSVTIQEVHLRGHPNRSSEVMVEKDIIILGDIKIELPTNNVNAILKAKKVLDLYLEDLLPVKRLITAKRGEYEYHH